MTKLFKIIKHKQKQGKLGEDLLDLIVEDLFCS